MSQQNPTAEEQQHFALRAFKGIEVGLGQSDPGAAIAAKLEAAHPGRLVLVQAGKFLHGYDRTAYALNILKNYQLKLVGTTAAPHLRIGFPAGNFQRRLWPLLADFGIPYVVALGTQASGHTVYVSDQPGGNALVLESVTGNLIAQAISDLQQRGELNKAAAKQLLANPETAGFKLKSTAQDLDTQLLHDIIKMPRDLRSTYGENLRATLGRILRAVFAYGLEDNKPALLRRLSADLDLLKHYLTQAPRLNGLKLNFESRAGLAVELGRLTAFTTQDYLSSVAEKEATGIGVLMYAAMSRNVLRSAAFLRLVAPSMGGPGGRAARLAGAYPVRQSRSVPPTPIGVVVRGSYIGLEYASMTAHTKDALASIVLQTELIVCTPYSDIAEYQGTRETLEAEGVIPAGTKWPEGFNDLHWEDGNLSYWLRRQRPDGAKGPRRQFIDVDWWMLRFSPLRMKPIEVRDIERKAKELSDSIYRHSAKGQKEWNQRWNRYWVAKNDEKFQAFKSLVPGLIQQKRLRKVTQEGSHAE